jgi:hypothetical protein
MGRVGYGQELAWGAPTGSYLSQGNGHGQMLTPLTFMGQQQQQQQQQQYDRGVQQTPWASGGHVSMSATSSEASVCSGDWGHPASGPAGGGRLDELTVEALDAIAKDWYGVDCSTFLQAAALAHAHGQDQRYSSSSCLDSSSGGGTELEEEEDEEEEEEGDGDMFDLGSSQWLRDEAEKEEGSGEVEAMLWG